MTMITLKGLAASPGIANGRVYLLETSQLATPAREVANPEEELRRFKRALHATRTQLEVIRAKTEREVGASEAAIFEAHLLILEDPNFLKEVRLNVLEKGLNAETSVQQAVSKFSATLEAIPDPYFKARSADIQDIGKRIVNNILGRSLDPLAKLESQVIVVARDLTPSDTAGMNRKMVLGFATDLGGLTSHTAILARSLNIPAVVGLGQVTTSVRNSEEIIVDGIKGVVVINPNPATSEQFEREKQEHNAVRAKLNEVRFLAAETPDGRRVEVSANIGAIDEVEIALSNGAEGIGLLRSEFLYLDRDTLPSEEELLRAYGTIAEKMKPRPVIVRTLDVGGDKPPRYLKMPPETNPFLGLRGIRVSLGDEVGRELLKAQLRAVLRAGKRGRLKVMFPMISDVGEVREVQKVLNEVRSELAAQGLPYQQVEVGIMIETPSAAVTADILAKEVNFFSIGTNDLIQYSMAADRTNARVSYLYDPLHPSILRLIRNIIDSGHRNGISVGMCGEMAGDPFCVQILLGLGLDEFSVGPFAIPRVKQIIRSTPSQEAISLAEEALKLETASETRLLAQGGLEKLAE